MVVSSWIITGLGSSGIILFVSMLVIPIRVEARMSNAPSWLRIGARDDRAARSTLLFVCTGNICRSAFAAASLRARVGDRVGNHVTSAGIRALHGWPMDPGMVRAGTELGLSLGPHEARQVTGRMIAGAAAVVVFDSEHRAWLREEFPEHMSRVVAIGQMVRGLATLPCTRRVPLAYAVEMAVGGAPSVVDDDWVADPYRCDDDVKLACAERILADIDVLAERVDWAN
ncbi:MAG: hypothetical protein E7K80_11275 [Cutibacterium avidum]|nr:hypothetical protein [Cutibacterium avidum]